MRNVVLLSSLKILGPVPPPADDPRVCTPGPLPRCTPRCAEAQCGARASVRPAWARPPWGGVWGGVSCVACASRGASSQASAVRSPASVPGIRRRIRPEHAATTPGAGTGPEPRGPYHRPVCTPRRRCCRTRDGCGSPCRPCVGDIPCPACRHPGLRIRPMPRQRLDPPAGGALSCGALHALRPCRAFSACLQGQHPWLAAWRLSLAGRLLGAWRATRL